MNKREEIHATTMFVVLTGAPVFLCDRLFFFIKVTTTDPMNLTVHNQESCVGDPKASA